MSAAPRRLIDLTETDLEEVLSRFVAERAVPANPEPLLLSGAQLAAKLGLSRTSVHRMREQGCPAIRVCDTYRYEIDRVMEWLRGRE